MRYRNNPIINSALILTAAGLLTRIMGFFYRIFLSRTIGAEGLGIYQLIFPIYGLCVSFGIIGFQTAISRFVASKKNSTTILICGLSMSLTISILVMFLIRANSSFIANTVLNDSRCDKLLDIIALTLPICSIHTCISGYYYGLRNASVPAWSQLFEQVIRIISVYIIAQIIISGGGTVSPVIAVYGVLFGELASSLFCILSLFWGKKKTSVSFKCTSHVINFGGTYSMLLAMVIPLSLNRTMLATLQSAEAILIPGQLRAFGMSSSEAISLYGVLQGMAMPFILLPSAITGSIAVMLLPEVAAADASNEYEKLNRTVQKVIKYTIGLGVFFGVIFVFGGKKIGSIVYHDSYSGEFISILGWLCPFMYVSTTLGSVLNGLGKTKETFIYNVIAVSIRLLFILFFIPAFGISGYMWGFLVSEILLTILHYSKVQRFLSLKARLKNSTLS